MAERNWGGGSDLSGLFSSLIDQFQSDVESATNRQIRKSKEDQAAEDAETFDKWNNGLINDSDWLAYIEGRLQDTEGGEDKAEHQQWVEMHRKHSDAIADGQVESQYQEGSISIHDVVAHYKSRMDGVEKASPEHREAADRYYSFVDRRDADYIDEQSAIIVDRIERGQGSYRELLAFYEGMTGKVRSSSTLANQIRRQILNIKQIVDAVGVSTGGGGGGSRGGRARRSGGGGGGGSDADIDLPSNIARANQLVADMYARGNVFVPQGEAIVNTVFDLFDIESTTDAILDGMVNDSKNIESMMNAWADDPDDPVLRTAFGQTIKNTAENRWAIYNQALANYDYRIALLTGLGKPGDVLAAQGFRSGFVDDIMELDNSIHAEPMWRVRREAFNQGLNIADSLQNPNDALSLYESTAKAMARAAKRMVLDSDRGLPEFKLDEDLMEELRYAEQFASYVADVGNMSPEDIQSVGSMLLDTRPSSFFLDDARITAIVGSTEGPTGSGLAGKAAAREGYRVTLDLRNGRMAQGDQYVYAARPGQSVPTLVKKDSVAEFLGIEDGNWMKNTRPFAERLNVREQPAIVYRMLTPMVAPLLVKEIGSGIGEGYVPESTLQVTGRNARVLAENEWEFVEVPELVGWRTVTDSQGTTWYVDPEDGKLYDRQPFAQGILGTGIDILDRVGENGVLDLERTQGAQGVPMGIGPNVDPRWAQMLVMRALDSGEIDPTLYFNRDVGTGVVPWSPMQIIDFEGTYWSEADAANRNLRRGGGGARAGRLDYMRDLRRRNEQRRQAAVREWFDTVKDQEITRHEQLDSVLQDSAIDIGARTSGVVMGRRQRPIDEAPDAPAKPAFEIQRRTAPTAPISIGTVRAPIMDPKIITPAPVFTPPRPAPTPTRATNPVPTRSTSPVTSPTARAITTRRPVIR